MAEPKELANKARTTLAKGLQALQSGADVPEELLDIAEPIAVSMGLLHKIEKGGATDGNLAGEALKTVRQSLDALQSIEGEHPAVEAAMEAVAGSLSKLFALSKALQGGNAPKPASQPPPAPTKGSTPPSQGKASRPPPAPRPQAASKPFAPVNKTVPMGDADQVRSEIVAAQAKQAARANQAAPAQASPQPTRPQQPAQPAPQPTQPQAPAGPEKERVPGMTDAPVPVGGAKQVSVELGAHSASNFYKGLSGNDVIDHGGIFVATYQIPKIGDAIALKMLLPGDLEFHADCIVQWIRETRSGEAEPGFGARFTRISNEGRQLIYRYVRNREPMFYDDM